MWILRLRWICRLGTRATFALLLALIISESGSAQEINGPLPAKSYISSCGTTQDHNEADLCEQRRSAQAASDAVWWSKVQTIANLFGLLALVASLAFTGWAARAASRAAHAAIGALNAERAWMSYTGLDTGLVAGLYLDGVYHHRGVMIRARWTNTGRSPATHLELVTDHRLVNGAETPTFTMTASGEVSQTTLGPSVQGTSRERGITWEEWERVKARQTHMWLYARADYRTVMQPHIKVHTEICGRLEYTGEVNGPEGPRPIVSLIASGPQNSTT